MLHLRSHGHMYQESGLFSDFSTTYKIFNYIYKKDLEGKHLFAEFCLVIMFYNIYECSNFKFMYLNFRK